MPLTQCIWNGFSHDMFFVGFFATTYVIQKECIKGRVERAQVGVCSYGQHL